jgi:hypothetical protein
MLGIAGITGTRDWVTHRAVTGTQKKKPHKEAHMSMQTYLHGCLLRILFLFPACPALLLAQTPEGFFPSQVGNLWQYSGDVNPTTNWRITRDSIGFDGRKFIFARHEIGSEYLRFRIDTADNVFENYQWWLLRYKLRADSGEAWIASSDFSLRYAWVYAIYGAMVFGRQTTVKAYRFGPFHPDSGGNEWYYHEHRLASGFGLVLAQGEPAYLYWLRGCVINGDTFGFVVNVPEPPTELPAARMLFQNYPNPFNVTTTIKYHLAERGIVRLRVFDLIGREVRTLAEAVHERGDYTVHFDATDLATGVYIYRIETPRGIQTRRMILLR